MTGHKDAQTVGSRPPSSSKIIALKSEIDKQLAILLDSKIAQAGRIDPVYADLLQSVAKLIRRGGKRLRPILAVLAYEGLGGTDHRAILRASISQELFHAFMLIHDDIIDRDDIRWGGPNISGHYSQLLSSELSAHDRRHFADAWALMAGDACYCLSLEVLLKSDFPAAKLVAAAQLMQASLFTTIGGELLDVALSVDPDSCPSDQRLINVARYKTASYSFQMPLRLGALLAGAPKKQLRSLELYGEQLGIAYQIHDDLIGIFGDEGSVGKPVLSDLQEGKQTLLISYGLRMAQGADLRFLQRTLGNPRVTPAELAIVQRILISSGARARANALMALHHKKADTLLTNAGFNNQTTTLLRSLTARLLEPDEIS